jgi:hypothetical protein
MTTRPLLARCLAGLMALTAVGVGGAPGAGALEPDCNVDDPPPVCDQPPPPSPTPGPIAREVQLHESDQLARPAAVARFNEILDRVAAPNRSRLGTRVVRLDIIPSHRDLTNYSPWTNRRGMTMPDENPNDDYVETRKYDRVRGFAEPCNRSGPLLAAAGEETVVGLAPGSSRHGSPATNELASTLTHETGHLIVCILTPSQRTTLTNLYENAFDRYPTRIVGRQPDYTMSDEHEYFAEGTAAWFEAGGDPSYRRSWLQANDPGLYALLDAVYDAPPAPRYCNEVRATKVMAGGSFTGSAGQDVVVGSAGRDVVNAAGGDDIVCGRSGDDELHGGDGVDVMFGEIGADQMYGDAGDDSMDGGDGADVMYGGFGVDRIEGRIGNDRIYGEYGADRLYGGVGDDRLEGGPDADSLYGGKGADYSYGAEGNDWLSDDYFGGGDGRPAEIGDGNDTMIGGPGSDELSGGAGDDHLNDSLGQDEMYGGDGRDHIAAEDNPAQKVPPGPDTIDGNSDANTCTYDSNDIVRRCVRQGGGVPPDDR